MDVAAPDIGRSVRPLPPDEGAWSRCAPNIGPDGPYIVEKPVNRGRMAKPDTRDRNQDFYICETDVHCKDDIAEIERLLHRHFGVDYSVYKPSTVLRRSERRRLGSGRDDVRGDRQLLEEDPEELSRLHHDLLIGVTGFFRDAESFAALRKHFEKDAGPAHGRLRA